VADGAPSSVRRVARTTAGRGPAQRSATQRTAPVSFGRPVLPTAKRSRNPNLARPLDRPSSTGTARRGTTRVRVPTGRYPVALLVDWQHLGLLHSTLLARLPVATSASCDATSLSSVHYRNHYEYPLFRLDYSRPAAQGASCSPRSASIVAVLECERQAALRGQFRISSRVR